MGEASGSNSRRRRNLRTQVSYQEIPPGVDEVDEQVEAGHGEKEDVKMDMDIDMEVDVDGDDEHEIKNENTVSRSGGRGRRKGKKPSASASANAANANVNATPQGTILRIAQPTMFRKDPQNDTASGIDLDADADADDLSDLTPDNSPSRTGRSRRSSHITPAQVVAEPRSERSTRRRRLSHAQPGSTSAPSGMGTQDALELGSESKPDALASSAAVDAAAAVPPAPTTTPSSNRGGRPRGRPGRTSTNLLRPAAILAAQSRSRKRESRTTTADLGEGEAEVGGEDELALTDTGVGSGAVSGAASAVEDGEETVEESDQVGTPGELDVEDEKGSEYYPLSSSLSSSSSLLSVIEADN